MGKYQFENTIGFIGGIRLNGHTWTYFVTVQKDGENKIRVGANIPSIRGARERLEGFLHSQKIMGETIIDDPHMISGWRKLDDGCVGPRPSAGDLGE